MRRVLRRALMGYRPAFSIEALFAAAGSLPGFDFSDLDPTKRWGPDGIGVIDTAGAGQNPVTTSGQSVFTLFDKQGLVAGADVAVNGVFAVDANWTKGAGWAIGGGTANYTSPGGGDFFQNVLVVNTFYRMSVDVVAVAGGQVGFGAGTNGAQYGATGSKVQYSRANAVGLFLRPNASTAITADNVTARPIPGGHAEMFVSNSRPLWQANGGLPYLAFDKNDDAMFMALTPGARNTIAMAVRPATPAGAIQTYMGAQTAAANNDRLRLSIDASGRLSGARGSQSEATIVDGVSGIDLSGQDAVILLREDGAFVELWLKTASFMGQVYRGPAAGNSPGANVSQVLYLGANNGNGALNQYAGGRCYGGVYSKQYARDGDVVGLLNKLAQNCGL